VLVSLSEGTKEVRTREANEEQSFYNLHNQYARATEPISKYNLCLSNLTFCYQRGQKKCEQEKLTKNKDYIIYIINMPGQLSLLVSITYV